MKRLLSLLISLAILAVIYWKIDLRALAQVLRDSSAPWMALSLGMVVPITLITAWRFGQLAPPASRMTFGESIRLILVASVLNMVLPSKMGDIAKAYFMKQRGGPGQDTGSLSLSLVLFEKACDMLSLLLWCVFGLMMYPRKDPLFWTLTAVVAAGLLLGITVLGSRKVADLFFGSARKLLPGKHGAKVERMQASWGEMQAYFWGNRGRLLRVTGTSVFLWFLHLLQIWLFILALKAWAPFAASLALAPLAILAGLLPLTFAGVGTRDAALIALYAPYFAAPTAAALGLLCTARYLLPALGGLPFLHQYLGDVRLLRTQAAQLQEARPQPS
jgi:glycosyltransferase 2 family protein